MPRYFVTGATGFIGGRLARLLRTAGHEVVTIARQPAKARDLVGLGVEVHPGDITDRASLAAPMRGADGVFHVAAWYKVGARDVHLAQAINVDGTRNVLEAMREFRVPKGVYTSTLAVFGDTHGTVVDESYRTAGPWPTEYERTKWVAHYDVALPMMAAGLPLVVVQSGVAYGPGDNSALRPILVQYLRRKLGFSPQGTAYCWGFVDDVAQAHVLAMEKGRVGESYIIAGPPHTFIEALAIAERITGIPAPRFHPTPGFLRGLAAFLRAVGRLVPLPESLHHESIEVVAGCTYLGDNAKARRELGFSPRPLEAGLRETLAHEMRLHGIPSRAAAT